MNRVGGSVRRASRTFLLALPVLGAALAPDVDPATREMARLLQEQAAKIDPAKLIWLVNDRRAELLAEQLEWPRPLTERLALRFNHAVELLNAGRNAEALRAIDALQNDADTNLPGAWAARGTSAILLRALAYLRMGEEENCHQGNNRDSCLWPIRGQGVHRKREGSTRAVEVLTGVLERSPDDLQARWLLNLAHMTLGSYPAGVPSRSLIPPSAFASAYPLPRFDNVAAEAGLDLYGNAGGAVLDDFDNDGRLDLLVSAIGFRDQLRLFHNKGDGSFEDRTAAARLTGETGGLNLIQADYDNDGFLDAVVLRGGWMGSEGRFPLSLLRNQGDGTFADVTRAAGLLRFAPSQTAVFFDYDGDGFLDLFVGNESTQDSFPCQLFHNNRDGTFTDVAKAAGVDFVGFVKGVTAGDYDDDGRPDLYLSVNGAENVLFHNEGAMPGGGFRFRDVAKEAGVTEPHASFGTFFFDYDNDGRPDLFVVGYPQVSAAEVAAGYLGLPTQAERGHLYRNRGDGTFEDVTRTAGLDRVILAMGHNYGDLDNDGFLDVYFSTGNSDLSTLVPNLMFRNDQGRSFQDVTTAGNFGHLQKGHAVCFGDIDNDGDQDVFSQMGGAVLSDKAYSCLYRNPGNANRWVSLELVGVRSNRSAIGARIEVKVETKTGSRLIPRTVGSGGSFGASPLRQEIGLGEARRISSVVVRWPSTGQRQLFADLQPGHRYRIREDNPKATLVDRPAFRLRGPVGASDRPAVLGP